MPCTCGEVTCECKDQCHCHPESCHCYDCDQLRSLAARRGYDRTQDVSFECKGCMLHPKPLDKRDPSSEGKPTDDLMFQMDDIDGVPQASTSAQRKADDSAGCSLRVNSVPIDRLPSPQWSYNRNYVSPLPSSGDSGIDLNPRASRMPVMPIFPDFSRRPGESSSATVSESGECKPASVPSCFPEPLPEAGSSKEQFSTQNPSEESPTSESVGMTTLTISDDTGSIDKLATLPESSLSVFLPESSEGGLTNEPQSVTSAATEPDSSEAPASNFGVPSSARPTSAESGSSIQALLDTEQSSEDSEPTDPSKEPE